MNLPPPRAGTIYEFQSDENKIVGSLVAVHAESLAAVGRQSNLITELVEHDTGRLQDCFFCFDHQNLHQATSYAANEMPFGIRKKQG